MDRILKGGSDLPVLFNLNGNPGFAANGRNWPSASAQGAASTLADNGIILNVGDYPCDLFRCSYQSPGLSVYANRYQSSILLWGQGQKGMKLIFQGVQKSLGYRGDSVETDPELQIVAWWANLTAGCTVGCWPLTHPVFDYGVRLSVGVRPRLSQTVGPNTVVDYYGNPIANLYRRIGQEHVATIFPGEVAQAYSSYRVSPNQITVPMTVTITLEESGSFQCYIQDVIELFGAYDPPPVAIPQLWPSPIVPTYLQVGSVNQVNVPLIRDPGNSSKSIAALRIPFGPPMISSLGAPPIVTWTNAASYPVGCEANTVGTATTDLSAVPGQILSGSVDTSGFTVFWNPTNITRDVLKVSGTWKAEYNIASPYL